MNLGEKIQLISTLSNLQSDRFFNKQDFCISELDKIENRMQCSFQPDRLKLPAGSFILVTNWNSFYPYLDQTYGHDIDMAISDIVERYDNNINFY